MKTRTLTCTLAIAAWTLSGTAGAAEWYLTPKVSLRSGYNSNLTLGTEPHNGVEELDLTPQAAFGRKTQTTGITGNVRFDGQRFWGESGLNTNSRLFNLHLYDNGQRMSWTLDGNITRDTTLQGELNATGLVLQRTPRVSRSLNPSWAYMINERTRLNLAYQHLDVRYPDQVVQQYENYQINAGTATITHQYNRRLQLFATGSVTYYRTTKNQLPFGSNIKARYDTLQGGVSYAFSQTLSASVSGGLRRATTTAQKRSIVLFLGNPLPIGPVTDVTTLSNGSVIDASLQKQLQTGSVNASFSRNIQPTGYGGLVQTNQLSVSADHRLNARFKASLDLSLYKTSAVGAQGVTGILDRTFVTVRPAIDWNITRWWELQGSYHYARQQYQSSSQSAAQNAVYVTLSYTWPKIAVSR